MKQSKRRLLGSIKWRVFLCCIGLAALILGMLWILQTCFLESFYQVIKEKEIAFSAQEIVSHIDDGELPAKLEDISRENQMCIVITDESGFVLYSEESWQNCVIHRMDAVLFMRAYNLTLQNGGTYWEQAPAIQDHIRAGVFRGEQHLSMMPKTMLYTVITEDAQGNVRFILLNTNLLPVDATVRTLRVQLIWVTVIMVGLGLVMALVLSYVITKPIQKINDSAKLLAKGKYEAGFSEEGYTEVKELAETLNYAARELSKVEGLQRELVANISHDLRTPLTMIIGYAEVMRDLPGENTPENVQVIIDEATRLTSLVNDVLDISKLQSGTEIMNVEIFNMTDGIRTILRRYSKMTDYSIALEAERDVCVKGDPLKLSQVLYNLVNNAITYTGADKTVKIIQSIHENRVRIAVIDTGDGIDPAHLKDIWNRYYKVDKSHKRAQIGTGLGLSIVKTILDQHPGTSYGVQSEQGKGSCFWFEMEVQHPHLREVNE